MVQKKAHTQTAIIGDGGWGTTIALHLAKKGYPITIWGPFASYIDEIKAARENRKFLPGFHIPESIHLTADLSEAVSGAEYVVLASPSTYLKAVLKNLAEIPHRGKYIILTKGIDAKSLKLFSDITSEAMGSKAVAVVSGPCISKEVAQGIPTAVTVAARSKKLRQEVRTLFQTDNFTVLESADVVGVQLGGALKNVIAIAAGILDGLGYGSNTKSVLLARGITEMVRLGKSLNAKPSTFLGLSGLGDLVTTGFSIHSRNHNCGVSIGQGKSVTQILKSTEMAVEGIEACKCWVKLARAHKVKTPIAEAVHKILFGKAKPDLLVDALMHKTFINEHE